MSFETQRKAIIGYLETKWDKDVHGPWFMENQEANQPSTIFTEITILLTGSPRVTLGTSYRKRHFGMLQFDIYTPENQGTRKAELILQMLDEAFDSVQIPTEDGQVIHFQSPSPRNLGNWSQRNRRVMSCPFYRDELRTRA